MLVAILGIVTALPDGAVPDVFAVDRDVVSANGRILTATTGYVVAAYPLLEPKRPTFPPFPPNLRGSAENATANPSSGGLNLGPLVVLVKNVEVRVNDLVRSSRYFV